MANGAHLMQGSITDEDALTECFSHKPDYVVHMAALFANQNSVDHPSDDLKVNGEGTVKCSNIQKLMACKNFYTHLHRVFMEMEVT